MKKTVLVLTSTFPRWENDTTPRFVFELSNRLANKNRKIIVLAPSAPNASKKERLENLEVHRFQYFPLPKLQKLAYGAGIIPNVKSSFLAKMQIPNFLMSEYLSARKLIKKYKPDILHAHWLIPQGILAVFLKKRYKIPLVVTVHGSDLFPLKNPVFKSIQKTVLENCDACTVNSTATKNEIISRFPKFKNKITVIPMGVDVKKFSGKATNKPKKYKNNKLILFVGRLNEQKGIEYLIKSAPYIKNNYPNIKLLIIGEGSYKAHLENVARSLNVRENVDFLWGIPHSKITDYYKMADVFVLPSITSKIGTEGLGLVLLEAMAAKVPVIGTNTGGIRYIIKNMQNGILVEERNPRQIAEGISLLLANQKLRAKITKNAFKFVNKNYSWDIVVKKFDKLYNKLK